MTSDELVRLDQRVVILEGIITSLQQRVILLEGKLEAAQAKVDTLNIFYGTALGETTNRLMNLLEKASGGTPAV